MNVSNCCKAPIIENTDLCSDCKEHCVAVDEFDEAMNTQDKAVLYNGKFVENCNSCQWNLTTEGHNKQKDMMCRNCSLAYTSNWTKKDN